MSECYFGTESRIARKSHKCDWCLTVIHKGELYLWGSGVYEDHMYSSKMHHECFEDQAVTCRSGEGWYPGDGVRPNWRFTDYGLKELYTRRGLNLKKLEKYVRPILTFDYL